MCIISFFYNDIYLILRYLLFLFPFYRITVARLTAKTCIDLLHSHVLCQMILETIGQNVSYAINSIQTVWFKKNMAQICVLCLK